jgi:hypothetical protein
VSASASTTQSPQDAGSWTVRGLLARHKWLALAAAAACSVLVAMFFVAVFGGKAGAVTDSTTCDQWGSANQNRQTTYARFYIREHGPVSVRWGPGATGVINAINAGCALAFGEDVSDTATVVQAISRDF